MAGSSNYVPHWAYTDKKSGERVEAWAEPFMDPPAPGGSTKARVFVVKQMRRYSPTIPLKAVVLRLTPAEEGILQALRESIVRRALEAEGYDIREDEDEEANSGQE